MVYRLIPRKTAEDLLLSLIKFGYGTETEILKLPIHTVLSRYNWFKKKRDEDLKNQQVNLDTLARLIAGYIFGKKR